MVKKRQRLATSQQTVIATTAAAAAAVVVVGGSIPQVQAARHDFSAFAFDSSHPRTSTPTQRLPTTTRWNIVSSISRHTKQTKDNVDEPTPRPTKNGRKKHKKDDHLTNRTISSKVAVGTNPRTESFGAITSTTYKSHGRHIDPDAIPVDVHTLILGTHPGIQSLEKSEYYGHPMNAFWWIAGDCLGFRRDTGISKSSGKPYQFTSHLRYGPDRIVSSYQDQLQVLTSHGFALWDIVQSCERPRSSLDSHISKDQPNDIPQFWNQHRHSLKRIVLANGTSGYSFFKKHFAQFLKSGEWQVVVAKSDEAANPPPTTVVQIIPALAVSPAAAKYSYVEKRDFWEQQVYQPGLQDFLANPSSSDV